MCLRPWTRTPCTACTCAMSREASAALFRGVSCARTSGATRCLRARSATSAKTTARMSCSSTFCRPTIRPRRSSVYEFRLAVSLLPTHFKLRIINIMSNYEVAGIACRRPRESAEDSVTLSSPARYSAKCEIERGLPPRDDCSFIRAPLKIRTSPSIKKPRLIAGWPAPNPTRPASPRPPRTPWRSRRLPCRAPGGP
jgi:hypothetical protein